MDFRGSNVQPQRDVVESARTNPADAVLDHMQNREEAMPRAMTIPVVSGTRVRGLSLATLPARCGDTQLRVNGGAFFCCRLRVG